MATRSQILGGPCKADLLNEGLGNLHPVEFTFEVLGRRSVLLQSMGPEDGSGERYLIKGLFQSAGSGAYDHEFSGYYDTKRRHGWYQATLRL